MKALCLCKQDLGTFIFVLECSASNTQANLGTSWSYTEIQTVTDCPMSFRGLFFASLPFVAECSSLEFTTVYRLVTRFDLGFSYIIRATF